MNNGKAGELLFKQIMIDKGYTVNDVTNTPDYWKQDIDFICLSPTTGLVKSFEVKWDDCIANTNNLFLEIYNPRSQNGLGWFEFCKADYLAYGDSKNKVFYIIPMPELRQRVASVPFGIAKTADDVEGILVPIGQIKDIVMAL